jgi:hypothetical protein
MLTKVGWKALRKRPLGRSGVDGRIIIKWILGT